MQSSRPRAPTGHYRPRPRHHHYRPRPAHQQQDFEISQESQIFPSHDQPDHSGQSNQSDRIDPPNVHSRPQDARPHQHYNHRPQRAQQRRYQPRGHHQMPRISHTTRESVPRDQDELQTSAPDVGQSEMGQSEMVERQLRNNTFECMICCDVITHHHQVWHCYRCYNIFHLRCAREWCKKSLEDRKAALHQNIGTQGLASSSLDNNHGDNGNSYYTEQRLASIEWPCPACREILHNAPQKYTCFCGKVERPEYRRYLTPHSCGQVCGRKRPEFDCPHTCNSLCHPGRCAACLLTSRKKCPCGKRIEEVRCSTNIETCDQICDKQLECGQHKCTRQCHSGSCDECTTVLQVKCHCGDQTIDYNCAQLSLDPATRKKKLKPFSCNKICDKPLDCGNHNCSDVCHAGPCPGCKLANENVTSCPCGSMRLEKSHLANRSFCLDPLPCCKGKCRKPLMCGGLLMQNRHQCQARCHTGACPMCPLKTALRCQCKSNTKSVKCSELPIPETLSDAAKGVHLTFNCEIRCNKPLLCGRHKCQLTCCTLAIPSKSTPANQKANGHTCDKICGRKLACGKHTCQELCHPGRCGDCPNIGWQELRCHCGSSVLYPPIACGTKAPACQRRCVRRHACSHPVQHECHNDSEPCPPCTHFVQRQCFCGAESKDSVYCYASGYSCGKACGRPLPCGRHTCPRVCHENACVEPIGTAGRSDDYPECRAPCPVRRFNCDHTCNLPCHSMASCPLSDCMQLVEIKCPCGHRKDRLECHKVSRDIDNRAKLSALSLSRNQQDCTIVLNLAPSKSADAQDRTVRLDCDESCTLHERNRNLAEALEIVDPDLSAIPSSQMVSSADDPLKELKEVVASDYKYACETFRSLSRFVQTARDSDKRFLFLKFAPSDRIRREIVYELASYFNCLCESHDEEPLKHVVVRAYKNKSCLPEFTIEQLAPRWI